MMSGAAEVADYQLQKIYDTIENPKQYLRINGDLKGTDIDSDMDNASASNMLKLKDYGVRLFNENRDRIKLWLEL